MYSVFINEFVKLQLETIVLFLLALGAIAHMLSTRKKPRSMIAWMFVIFTLPYIGIPLYIIFSGRKIEKFVLQKGMLSFKSHTEANTFASPVSDFLMKLNVPAPSCENSVSICKDGVDAYRELMTLLKSAQKNIYISTYIFGNDEVTHEIVDILCQKSQEGVDVKLLMDALGSARLEFFPSMLKKLNNAGGDYSFFNSFVQNPVDFKINLRNHRKSIIVDSHTVMGGGMNIAKEYMAPYEHDKLWTDLSFIIQGEAVQYYLEIFSFDWKYITGETLSTRVSQPTSCPSCNSLVQVVPSGPDIQSDAFYETMMYAFFMAQKRIWLVTPYFAPDQSILDALVVARHRGVDVRIIVPDTSDHLIVDIARNGFLRDLQEEGIGIFFYKNKMLHAKAVLIDDTVAVMGSSNFDERSFFYNYETMSFFYSKNDVAHVQEWIDKLFLECSEGLKKATKIRISFENIFKMIAPAI